MSVLQMWIHSPFAGALGWTLAHFVWEGAAIAAILAVAMAVFRGGSARVRYGLACAALVAMPVAFGVTLGVLMPHSPVKVMVPIPLPEILQVAVQPGSPATPEPWSFASLLPWAAPLWLAGVAAFLLYRFASWIAAQRMRRLGICPAPQEWSLEVDALAARLHISRSVKLLESYLAEVPMVIGYLRPVILVPIGMLAGLPIDQVEAILLHELAHIRRADYLVNLLQTMVESALFYHPAVWWISNVVRAERENCCDDFVLARDTDPRAYAAALVALEQGRASELVLAASGGNLVRRVRRILRVSQTRSGSPTVTGGVSPVALAIVGAGIAFAAWQPEVLKPVESVQSTPAPVVAIPTLPTQIVKAAPHLIAQAQPARQARKDAEPQFVSKYFLWLNMDVVYIITNDEKKAFQALTTDDEREMFIKQFWERRDPTPGTEKNEYRDEHYRRIAYANERYAPAGRTDGWSTDRGRIYITYGPPNELEAHPSGGIYQRPAEQGGGTTYTSPFQKWRYRFIEGMGTNVIIEFVDGTGNGEYRMTMDPSVKEVVAQAQPAGSSVVSGENRRFSRTDGQAVQSVGSKESEWRIEQLKSNIRAIREQVATLRVKYGDEHPVVRDRLFRIQTLESMVDDLSRSVTQQPGPLLLTEPVQIVAGSAPKDWERRRTEQAASFFRDELAALRARYGEAHPDVQAMRLTLDKALQEEASLRSPGFNGKHSGVLIYPGGHVSFVVPLEGPGPFKIYGRITTLDWLPIANFEQQVANSSTLNFVKTMDLKPGSYEFKLAMNGVVETVMFEIK